VAAPESRGRTLRDSGFWVGSYLVRVAIRHPSANLAARPKTRGGSYPVHVLMKKTQQLRIKLTGFFLSIRSLPAG